MRKVLVVLSILPGCVSRPIQFDVMQVILRNPSLSLLAANELLDLAKIPGSDIQHLLQQFRHGSVMDLEALARSIRITVSITDVATPAISEDDLFRYFVEHGASRQMIRDLVRPIGGNELASLRTELNVSASKPRAIQQQHAMEILDRWSAVNQKQTPTAQKLMTLHQEFHEYSLATLYALINEV